MSQQKTIMRWVGVNAEDVANKLVEVRKELFRLDPDAPEKIMEEIAHFNF